MLSLPDTSRFQNVSTNARWHWGRGGDVPYSPEHEELAELMAEHGCLISEFPPRTPPLKYHFPQRNRLIAGLARAVLVVEAPEKSDALITAQHALEEGKEVFAVPGPSTSGPVLRGLPFSSVLTRLAA